MPALILLVWQGLSVTGLIPARVLPAPLDVARAGWEMLTEGTLIKDVAISARRALLGFLIGGGIGFVLGLINGFFPWGARLLDSTVQMARNIPHLALIPLVILWFGIGETARLFLVASALPSLSTSTPTTGCAASTPV